MSRAWPLVALAVLLVAGCASPAAEGPAPAMDGNQTVAPAAAPMDDGTMPNATVDTGHMPHLHDYWKQRERVTLFEGEVDPSAIDPFSAAFYAGVRQELKVGGTPWRLPDGAIVYEGTGRMEVTASWDDPRVTSLAMAYATPGSPNASAEFPLQNGKPHVIDVTPDMTDMPHMSTSRWGFGFMPSDSPGAAMAPFRLKVDIAKVRDIMLFPPHPRHFGDAHEKVLLDKEFTFEQVSYARRAPNVVTEGEFGEDEVMPEHLVPMETLWLKAEVTVLRAESVPGQVVDVRFFYHGADNSTLGHPYWLPSVGNFAAKRMEFHFPVKMEQTDTPYGTKSQWRFLVEPVTSLTGQDPACGGCTDTTFSYRIKLTAYDHALTMPASKPSGN